MDSQSNYILESWGLTLGAAPGYRLMLLVRNSHEIRIL